MDFWLGAIIGAFFGFISGIFLLAFIKGGKDER